MKYFRNWLIKRKIKMLVDAEYQRLVAKYRYDRPMAAESRTRVAANGMLEIYLVFNDFQPIITGPLDDSIKNDLRRQAESNVLNTVISGGSNGK